MKPQITAPELTFTRSFEFNKGTHKISATFQPYCVGMYVALTDTKLSELLQMNLPHKKVKQWVKSLTKKLIKDGYTSTATESKYSSFLKVDEIETYILPDFKK